MPFSVAVASVLAFATAVVLFLIQSSKHRETLTDDWVIRSLLAFGGFCSIGLAMAGFYNYDPWFLTLIISALCIACMIAAYITSIIYYKPKPPEALYGPDAMERRLPKLS